jgi:hypothetical protein
VSFDGGVVAHSEDADAGGLTGVDVGDALMAMVTRAREAGVDPDCSCAPRAAGSVRERERVRPAESAGQLVSVVIGHPRCSSLVNVSVVLVSPVASRSHSRP